jgi:hypothetical protein
MNQYHIRYCMYRFSPENTVLIESGSAAEKRKRRNTPDAPKTIPLRQHTRRKADTKSAGDAQFWSQRFLGFDFQ